METVESKDGTTIAFDRAGEGAPIILVGGAMRDRSSETPLVALLATEFTVFAYDRRGRGDSDDTAPYAVDREIEDLGAVVAEAGGSACVYGSSSGANLALEAASRGLGVRKLVVHEPNFLVDGSRPPLPGDYVARLTELVSAGRRGDAVEYFMTVAAGVPPEFVRPMREMPIWAGMEAAAHTLPYDGMVVQGFTLPTERLAAITAPTLVVDGDASDAWLQAATRAVAEALPNAERRTLEDQEHNVAPDAMAPVLKEFFAR